MPKLVRLNCLINGDKLTQYLTVEIDNGDTFASLKKAILAEDPDRFVGVGPSQLTLYKLDKIIPIVDDGVHQHPTLGRKLFVGEIKTVFSKTPPRVECSHSCDALHF